MYRLMVCALLALVLAEPAHAQEPSTETMQAASDLAAVMSSDTVGQLSAALTAQIWPNIERQFGSKVDAGTLTDLRGDFQQSLSSVMAEVMRDTPNVYARHFTAQELRDMLAFYKSTVGQKALKTMPIVMAEVGERFKPRVQAFQADLNAKMETTLRNHGYGQ